MNRFYVSLVGESVTDLGITRPRAIGIKVRTHSGVPIALRLIPGFDPYMSFLIVRNGLLGLYRFDRRMSAMSDRAEANGLDHDAVKEIAEELCRNLFSKETGIIFLKQMVGEFRFPEVVSSIGGSGVYVESDLLFTLTRSRGSIHGYDVGLGKIPLIELGIHQQKIVNVDPTLTKDFARKVRAKYGHRVAVTFSGCVIKN